MLTAVIVGVLQLLFHFVRTAHIRAIADCTTGMIAITSVLYQLTVISSFALGVDAWLNDDWLTVASFVILGALGSVLSNLTRTKQ